MVTFPLLSSVNFQKMWLCNSAIHINFTLLRKLCKKWKDVKCWTNDWSFLRLYKWREPNILWMAAWSNHPIFSKLLTGNLYRVNPWESSKGVWPITTKLLFIVKKSDRTLNKKNKNMFEVIILQESLKIMRK